MVRCQRVVDWRQRRGEARYSSCVHLLNIQRYSQKDWNADMRSTKTGTIQGGHFHLKSNSLPFVVSRRSKETVCTSSTEAKRERIFRSARAAIEARATSSAILHLRHNAAAATAAEPRSAVAGHRHARTSAVSSAGTSHVCRSNRNLCSFVQSIWNLFSSFLLPERDNTTQARARNCHSRC